MCFELKLDTELEGGKDLNVLIRKTAAVYAVLPRSIRGSELLYALWSYSLAPPSSHPHLNIHNRERLSLSLNISFYTNPVLTDDCTSQNCKDHVRLSHIKEVPLSEIGSLIGSAANVCVEVPHAGGSVSSQMHLSGFTCII